MPKSRKIRKSGRKTRSKRSKLQRSGFVLRKGSSRSPVITKSFITPNEQRKLKKLKRSPLSSSKQQRSPTLSASGHLTPRGKKRSITLTSITFNKTPSLFDDVSSLDKLLDELF